MKPGTVATTRFDERVSPPPFLLIFSGCIQSCGVVRGSDGESRSPTRFSRVFLSAVCESRVRITVGSVEYERRAIVPSAPMIPRDRD